MDSTGIRNTSTYDENGSRTAVSVAGRTTTFTFDELNRLTRTQWPDGSNHTAIYRPDNRKASETDARGVTTSYGYDAAGRLITVSQSLSPTSTATTTYSYDETGAKTTQVDANGHASTWTQDAAGRNTARRIQDGSQEAYTYDPEGNRIGHKTFAGEQLSFQYDVQSRMTGAVVPQGTGSNSAVPASSILFRYTQAGQLASVQEQGPTSLNGTQAFSYDANDRLIGTTSPVGRQNFTLDAAGNITENSEANASANAGTTRREYDDAGRLAKVIARDGKQTVYTYDAAGRLVRTGRELNASGGQPQTLVTYNRYDNADRIIAVAQVKRVGSTETVVAGQSLTRSAGGTISQIDTYRSGTYDSATGVFSGTPARIQTFEYDGNARLTRENSVKGGATTDTRYEYDPAGNRKTKTVTTAAGTEITTYSHDVADRLTQESVRLPAGGNRVTTYTYDGNGNLASKTEPGKVTLYRFDPQNRLIDIRTGATLSAAQSASPSVTYAYDASGNRVRKGSGTYLIDRSYAYPQVALESHGTASTAYVRGLSLIRQTRLNGSAAQDIFPLQGHLGTSLGAVDADGNLVEQVDADAFGNLEQPTALQQTHLYTGEYWDQDAQLFYLRARWYDPRTGSFISADPFEGRQSDTRSLNRYGYAHGDPVHGIDPSGEMTLGETGTTANVQGTLATIGQQSLQTQIRQVMLGNPKKGDFGIIGDLIIDQMLGAVEEVLADKSFAKKSGQAKGTQAHALIEERIKLLNRWIKGIPFAKDIEIKAELFLLPNGAQSSRGVKGAMGLDVVLIYRGRKFVAFDLKMGGSTISNTKYFEYQRRFGARLFLIRFK